MTKDRPVHYRPKREKDDDDISCNQFLAPRDVVWTADAKDVTCDRCLKSRVYRLDTDISEGIAVG